MRACLCAGRASERVGACERASATRGVDRSRFALLPLRGCALYVRTASSCLVCMLLRDLRMRAGVNEGGPPEAVDWSAKQSLQRVCMQHDTSMR
jgi:hypothetical protein